MHEESVITRVIRPHPPDRDQLQRDVNQFVAQMRTALQSGSDDIELRTAETVLHAALADVAGIDGPNALTKRSP